MRRVLMRLVSGQLARCFGQWRVWALPLKTRKYAMRRVAARLMQATITAPLHHHHCTITAPSLCKSNKHHHCVVTVPVLHHYHLYHHCSGRCTLRGLAGTTLQ